MAPPDEISEHSDFDMLNAELTQFARCIREQRTYPVPIADILHGMSVFDAVVRSACSNSIGRKGEEPVPPACILGLSALAFLVRRRTVAIKGGRS